MDINILLLIAIIVVIICYNSTERFEAEFHRPDEKREECQALKEEYMRNGFKVIDGFLTDAECDHVIKLASGKLKRAHIMGNSEQEVSAHRTNYITFIPREKDATLQLISERASKLTGIPLINQEQIQILKYNNDNQYYKRHYDACLTDNLNCRVDHNRGGVRINTVLIYLTDVDEGGETSFNNLDEVVKPKKGRAVIFSPVTKNGSLTNKALLGHDKTKFGGGKVNHPCSLHTAHKVVRGEKWNMTIWSRSMPFT